MILAGLLAKRPKIKSAGIKAQGPRVSRIIFLSEDVSAESDQIYWKVKSFNHLKKVRVSCNS